MPKSCIRQFVPALFCILAAVLMLATRADCGEQPNDWLLTGDNTMRSDYYGVRGDTSASGYRFEGLHSYDQLNLNLMKRRTPYERWRIQLSGVANDSDYRNPDNGFIPERLNLFVEKGDTAVPFRFESGDIYGYFSYRTLQRSLKGIQVELQPHAGTGNRRHSILLVSGANQPTWRHFRGEDNYTSGLSYLFHDKRFGRYGLNYVHNSREGDMAAGTLERTQNTYSITGERAFNLFSQRLTLEGELAGFSGDHDGTTGVTSGQDRDDEGIFAQLSGKSRTPLTYRFRYEAYGQDFRPVAASVSASRRSTEYHAGWRFEGGQQLRGRIQDFRDGYETANPTDTRTYGLNLSGPMLTGVVDNMSGSINAFIQNREDRVKTTDQDTTSVTLNLSKPIYAGWNGSLGLFYQHIDNHITGLSDITTKQVHLSGDHTVEIFGFKGSVAPGFVLRKIDDSLLETLTLNPTLGLNLEKGRHSITDNIFFEGQDRHTAAGTDVDTFTHNFSYQYRTGNNTLGLEYVHENRDPDPGEETESYVVGAFWTYTFNKRLHRKPKETPPPAAVSTEGEAFTLAALVPGTDLALVKRTLERAGIRGGIARPNVIVYDTRLLDELEQRQRLVLVHQAGRLTKSALIVDFDYVGGPADIMETFARVRNLFVDRYGRPSSFYEKGDAGENLAKDINSSTFIRIVEWNITGGTVRFGIPRRRDRQVRMEVQFSKAFPSPTQTLWSIENVR